MITIDQIRAAALALPEVVERASYGGRPSWRAGPRMFAWVREDPEALVVWVDSVEDKHALIATRPRRSSQPLTTTANRSCSSTSTPSISTKPAS